MGRGWAGLRHPGRGRGGRWLGSSCPWGAFLQHRAAVSGGVWLEQTPQPARLGGGAQGSFLTQRAAGAPKPVGQQAGCPARQAGRRESRVAAGGPGLGGEWETKGTIAALFGLQGAARWLGPISRQLTAGLLHSQPRPDPSLRPSDWPQPGPARTRPAWRTLPQAGLHHRSGSPRGGALWPGARERLAVLRRGPASLACAGPATRALPSPSRPRYCRCQSLRRTATEGSG